MDLLTDNVIILAVTSILGGGINPTSDIETKSFGLLFAPVLPNFRELTDILVFIWYMYLLITRRPWDWLINSSSNWRFHVALTKSAAPEDQVFSNSTGPQKGKDRLPSTMFKGKLAVIVLGSVLYHQLLFSCLSGENFRSQFLIPMERRRRDGWSETDEGLVAEA